MASSGEEKRVISSSNQAEAPSQNAGATVVSYRKIDCPNCRSDQYEHFITGKELVTYQHYKKLEGFGQINYVRCKACGLIYSNPRLVYTNTTLNNISPTHVERRRKRNQPFQEKLLRKKAKMLETIVNILGERRGQFLEVGCGLGYALVAARDQGFEVVATELYPGYIEICRAQGFNVIPGNVHSIPFPDRSCDVVFLDDVLEHLDQPFDFLDEVSRVLKPGGVAFLHTWVIDEPTTVQAGFGEDWRLDTNLDLTAHTTIFPTPLLLAQCVRRGLIPLPEKTFSWPPSFERPEENSIKFCGFYTRKE